MDVGGGVVAKRISLRNMNQQYFEPLETLLNTPDQRIPTNSDDDDECFTSEALLPAAGELVEMQRKILDRSSSLLVSTTSSRFPSRHVLFSKTCFTQVQLPRRVKQCREVAVTATIKEKVSELEDSETKEKFKTCMERIGGLGFDDDESEKVVGQAFGWGRQAYWLDKKKDEAPNLEQIESVLAYLKDDLGLEGEDLQKVVKKFPEVINLDVEKRLKVNVDHMQKAYYMKKPQATNAVKRTPDVLGYTVDCEGSCYGLCNQCWVRL